MKSFVLLMTLFLAPAFVNGQDSWRIVLNGKLVLTSHESNETVNIKPVKSSEWKKKGYLEVNYKETSPSTWLHSLQFTDELGNQLLVKDRVTASKIPISVLRKLYAGKKQLKIYMVINPPNPMMGAPSRMIHLGTLKLP